MEEGDALRVAAMFPADTELEVRVRLAAALAGHLDQLADPALVEVSKGFSSSRPLLRYSAKNFSSASSRLMPQTIWVRSLVPKEKKSAWPAISPATAHARGSSIMVPMGSLSSASSARIRVRILSNSDGNLDERDHYLDHRVSPSLPNGPAPSLWPAPASSRPRA